MSDYDKAYAMAYARAAIGAFLQFDNYRECPDPELDYDAAVRFENERLSCTEALAHASNLLAAQLPDNVVCPLCESTHIKGGECAVCAFLQQRLP